MTGEGEGLLEVLVCDLVVAFVETEGIECGGKGLVLGTVVLHYGGSIHIEGTINRL